MDAISTGLAVNKTQLPVELPEDRSGNRSDSEATITSDLTLAAPASLAVSRDGETEWRGDTTFPEVLPPYWMCDKASGEYESLRADFQAAVKLVVNAEAKNNEGDGLQFMRSSPAQFRGFPADDYHKLLRKSCGRGEERLGRLMEFSVITGSDSQREMRWEIIEELYNAIDYDDRPSMKEMLDRRIKNSINSCLEHLGQDSADSSNKFILDLLGDVSTFRPRYRLIALIRLCEIIPEKIKQIPKSDLEDLPATLALNEADTSGALKCLGETTGYVFLPHGIFADWEEIASLNPDVQGDQRVRTYFADQLRHRVDKIVDDGRDANLVMREIVLRLARLDEDTQSAGAKLLREFFKSDLSSMFAASGGKKALGIIGNYCDRAKLEFTDFSKEIAARLKGGKQLKLQESFKESAQARIRNNREWNHNRDYYYWSIGSDLQRVLINKEGAEKRAAVMDILDGFDEWADGRGKYFALQDFSAIMSDYYRVTITDIIGKDAANAWLSENYAVSDREFAFAREHLGLDKVETTPEEAGEEFIVPYNSSERMKWAERNLLSICGMYMNGSGTAFDMPPSFNNLSWQDRADAMQLTVNWAMRPLNNDTFKKLRAMAASDDLRGLMANTVTKRKFAEVKDFVGADSLSEFMKKHRMVRSN
ncbi:hypothetical protein PAQ31011_01207 [Pandoraea aquatica]|uniref:Uncharacterized protein n=1 Tax=Pandoraea aquatica TaxID=2508290 RepID=A0A5E4T6X8_9BURK|nr:hypothetical protein [Pandoraea aquatica]VVD82972.1 hypothetical protein PAQ31011_01207 [Pandoraea aquatica]